MPRPRQPASPFRYFNSSPEVIRLAVLLYVKYPLSLRNVEDLLAERGIDISHETVRYWWNRFGPPFAADIRRQRVSRMRGFRQWRWHLDEMYVKVNGEMRYLWRAVDHEGEILESFVTKERDKAAALRFMKKALKRHGSPEAITTDGLRSYRAAMTELGNSDKQESGRCSGSEGWRACRSSHPSTPTSTTTSTPNVTSSTETPTSNAARQHLPSGSRCSADPADQRHTSANRRKVRV